MIPILKQIDHTGKVIVDIGANIGACALMFSYFAPVFAYEPFHIDILKENCNQDTIHKIIPIGKALSDKVETRKFYYEHANCGSGSFNDTFMKEACEFVSTTLDLEDVKDPISFIKIDVQGDDIKVLRGAHNTLVKNKPIVAVECETDEQRKSAFDYMKSIGYNQCMSCPENMLLFTC